MLFKMLFNTMINKYYTRYFYLALCLLVNSLICLKEDFQNTAILLIRNSMN